MSAPEQEPRLRHLADAFGWLIFTLAVYLGAAILIGGHDQRLTGVTWGYVWEMPAAMWVWSTPPILGGGLGWLALTVNRYRVAAIASMICSGWAFTLGLFLFASWVNPHANLLWPPLVMFLSAAYSMLGLSFTTRFL